MSGLSMSKALKSAGDDMRRRRDFPAFFAIANGLISAVMATLEGGDSNSFDGEPDRHKITAPLGESNIVGSEVKGKRYRFSIFEKLTHRKTQDGERLHKPVLDIDIPIWAKESTTEGHYHLIIDKEMPESDYFELLDVMAKVGILEKGFVDAATARGGSWIRTPWTKKHKENNSNEY